jgi:protein SCO1
MTDALINTACMCAVLAGGFAFAVFKQTSGLENWTFEAQRRQQAREGRMWAPPVALGESSDMGAGRVQIVDFIYTRCPGLCEGLGAQFRLMQRELQRQGEAVPVSLLSISFDLAGDTPERLAAYSQRHGADASVWRVTRPADRKEADRLLRALGIVAIEDGTGGFVHNSALHVIDQHGQVRGIFDYGNWQAALHGAERLARELAGTRDASSRGTCQ